MNYRHPIEGKPINQVKQVVFLELGKGASMDGEMMGI